MAPHTPAGLAGPGAAYYTRPERRTDPEAALDRIEEVLRRSEVAGHRTDPVAGRVVGRHIALAVGRSLLDH